MGNKNYEISPQNVEEILKSSWNGNGIPPLIYLIEYIVDGEQLQHIWLTPECWKAKKKKLIGILENISQEINPKVFWLKLGEQINEETKQIVINERYISAILEALEIEASNQAESSHIILWPFENLVIASVSRSTMLHGLFGYNLQPNKALLKIRKPLEMLKSGLEKLLVRISKHYPGVCIDDNFGLDDEYMFNNYLTNLTPVYQDLPQTIKTEELLDRRIREKFYGKNSFDPIKRKEILKSSLIGESNNLCAQNIFFKIKTQLIPNLENIISNLEAGIGPSHELGKDLAVESLILIFNRLSEWWMYKVKKDDYYYQRNEFIRASLKSIRVTLSIAAIEDIIKRTDINPTI
jgi:hypothetical protein